MLESLPDSITTELRAAQRAARGKRSRLRVEANGESYRILRLTPEGFALDLEDAPKLRGLVDIFDGAKHQFQCLIVATEEAVPGEMHYEFKRATAVADRAALDFEVPEGAPAGLITGGD